MSEMTEAQKEARTKNTTEGVFRPGIKNDEVVAKYNEWSENYDEIIRKDWYNAPGIALQEVLKLFPPAVRPSTAVLDVAAGTGRVGQDLHKEGFRLIDAVEPSEGMMKKLRECGVYRNSYIECIGTGHSTVPADSYDLVVISGGMGEGHIPVSGMDDLVSFAKKGGLVLIAMRLEFLECVEAYKGKLEAYMDELEKKGAWSKVERRVVPNYYFGKEGVVFIYRVA